LLFLLDIDVVHGDAAAAAIDAPTAVAAAAAADKTYATVLLDLVKAFETIPHQHVLNAAKGNGYNLWVLRLSLKAYRVPRTIMVDGVCSSLHVATQGITAGSGFATEELACLLMEACDALLENYPSIDLTEYVDDLTLGQAGPGWFVVDILASATNFIIEWLEGKLQLTISRDKSVVTASTVAIAKRAAEK